MKIINKTKWALPDYLKDSLREICHKADISEVTLIVKARNRYRGDCWRKKGNTNSVSGTYKLDRRTVIIRLGKKSLKEDIKFVLAHEIGHLKQHIASHLEVKLTEDYASRFALLECNCYPKSKYRISKIRSVRNGEVFS